VSCAALSLIGERGGGRTPHLGSTGGRGAGTDWARELLRERREGQELRRTTALRRQACTGECGRPLGDDEEEAKGDGAEPASREAVCARWFELGAVDDGADAVREQDRAGVVERERESRSKLASGARQIATEAESGTTARPKVHCWEHRCLYDAVTVRVSRSKYCVCGEREIGDRLARLVERGGGGRGRLAALASLRPPAHARPYSDSLQQRTAPARPAVSPPAPPSPPPPPLPTAPSPRRPPLAPSLEPPPRRPAHHVVRQLDQGLARPPRPAPLARARGPHGAPRVGPPVPLPERRRPQPATPAAYGPARRRRRGRRGRLLCRRASSSLSSSLALDRDLAG